MTRRTSLGLLRPDHNRPSPWSSPKVFHSVEPDGCGSEVNTTTVFLIGAECPFRCTMCDLWQFTTIENTPIGAIPHQLREALKKVEPSRRQWLKLYNASNFFDSRSVPLQDLETIATLCDLFERVIVENHPRLCDERMRWFADRISGQLEVAMGLETIHSDAMSAMNKGMSLSDFDTAVEQCHRMQIDVRVFVLLHPPGVEIIESAAWTWKTIEYTLKRNIRHVSIIPVRAGNGWIDNLIERGEYELPSIALVCQMMETLFQNEVTIPEATVIEFDLWDWEKIRGGCERCRGILKEHIVQSNLNQRFLPFGRIGVDCGCTV